MITSPSPHLRHFPPARPIFIVVYVGRTRGSLRLLSMGFSHEVLEESASSIGGDTGNAKYTTCFWASEDRRCKKRLCPSTIPGPHQLRFARFTRDPADQQRRGHLCDLARYNTQLTWVASSLCNLPGASEKDAVFQLCRHSGRSLQEDPSLLLLLPALLIAWIRSSAGGSSAGEACGWRRG